LLLGSSESWGGSEELWSQTAQRLIEAGDDVAASVVYHPVLARQVEAMRAQGLKVQLRGAPRPLPRIWHRVLRRVRAVPSPAREDLEMDWIREFRPDLVVISAALTLKGLGFRLSACRRSLLDPLARERRGQYRGQGDESPQPHSDTSAENRRQRRSSRPEYYAKIGYGISG
jgi:hypothetical protein